MSDKNLYVIQLNADVLKLGKFWQENPEYQSGKPCMYVGVTSHNPKKRFNQHTDGYKSSRIVKKYGEYLMWKKFRHLNPVLSNKAEIRECALAMELRQKGYGVWQK